MGKIEKAINYATQANIVQETMWKYFYFLEKGMGKEKFYKGVYRDTTFAVTQKEQHVFSLIAFQKKYATDKDFKEEIDQAYSNYIEQEN